MKVIDLLNKIANGEIETYTKFVYDNKIMNVENLIDNYLFLCILNEEVKIINDKKIFHFDKFDKEKVEIGNSLLEEEKKIPEKILKDEFDNLTKEAKLWELFYKYNNLIDYLKSKGE